MSAQRDIKMWTPHTLVLFLLLIAGIGAALLRMSKGLGTVTNLTDVYPWGFWLGFDVLGGVAMAAGGFVIACAVSLFNWKKYKPLVRPAILTAFLGYTMELAALFLDIGHPFRIWHPMVMWQVHSVLWLVAVVTALCFLVVTVQTMDPVLEKQRLHGLRTALQKIFVPLVVVATVLSIVHQASLGAVFLIAPSKISPLWYSQFLPYMFLISAIAMGLAMVSTESMLSEKAFGHTVNKEIFDGLGRGLRNTLIIYLALKIFFLLKNAGIGMAFNGSLEGNMFLLEMAVGIILPLALLLNRSIAAGKRGLLGVNIMVIAGVLLNRMNVCIFSMQEYAASRGHVYFPALMEFVVTLGIVSLGIILFKLAAKYLPLFAEA